MAIKTARRLFWLWLVLSMVWVGGVALQTWRDIPRDDWVRTEVNQASDAQIALPISMLDPIVRVFIERGVKLALFPPIIVLACGAFFIWLSKRRHRSAL